MRVLASLYGMLENELHVVPAPLAWLRDTRLRQGLVLTIPLAKGKCFAHVVHQFKNVLEFQHNFDNSI